MSGDAEAESPFRVLSSASLGRHAVATRRIPAGSVVLRDQPIFIAPCKPSKADRVTCLGCCTVVPESSRKLCPGCGGPLCRASCKDSPYHRDECLAMQQCNFRFENGSTSPNHLQMLAFLRVLLQTGEKAERIRRLESHSERLLADPTVLGQLMSRRLEKLMPPLLEYSLEERVWAYGVLEFNEFCFTEPHAGREAGLLMDQVSLLSHSCVGNAYIDCYSRPEGATGPAALDGLRNVVVAATDIEAGSAITVNRTNPHMHTEWRREDLRECEIFECHCPRCEDPTELGLYSRSQCCLPCQKAGRLELPVARSVGDAVTSWRCRRCGTAMETSAYMLEREAIGLAFGLETAVKNGDVAMVESLGEMLHPRGRLHPTHELVLDAKWALCMKLYDKLPGLEMEKLNASQLRLLSGHCRDYLRAAAIFEPGFGLRMALVNLTLNRTLLEMIRRTAKLPPRELALARMKEAEACMEKVHTALRHSSDMQDILREQQLRTEQVRGILASLGILDQASQPAAP